MASQQTNLWGYLHASEDQPSPGVSGRRAWPCGDAGVSFQWMLSALTLSSRECTSAFDLELMESESRQKAVIELTTNDYSNALFLMAANAKIVQQTRTIAACLRSVPREQMGALESLDGRMRNCVQKIMFPTFFNAVRPILNGFAIQQVYFTRAWFAEERSNFCTDHADSDAESADAFHPLTPRLSAGCLQAGRKRKKRVQTVAKRVCLEDSLVAHEQRLQEERELAEETGSSEEEVDEDDQSFSADAKRIKRLSYVVCNLRDKSNTNGELREKAQQKDWSAVTKILSLMWFAEADLAQRARLADVCWKALLVALESAEPNLPLDKPLVLPTQDYLYFLTHAIFFLTDYCTRGIGMDRIQSEYRDMCVKLRTLFASWLAQIYTQPNALVEISHREVACEIATCALILNENAPGVSYDPEVEATVNNYVKTCLVHPKLSEANKARLKTKEAGGFYPGTPSELRETRLNALHRRYHTNIVASMLVAVLARRQIVRMVQMSEYSSIPRALESSANFSERFLAIPIVTAEPESRGTTGGRWLREARSLLASEGCVCIKRALDVNLDLAVCNELASGGKRLLIQVRDEMPEPPRTYFALPSFMQGNHEPKGDLLAYGSDVQCNQVDPCTVCYGSSHGEEPELDARVRTEIANRVVAGSGVAGLLHPTDGALTKFLGVFCSRGYQRLKCSTFVRGMAENDFQMPHCDHFALKRLGSLAGPAVGAAATAPQAAADSDATDPACMFCGMVGEFAEIANGKELMCELCNACAHPRCMERVLTTDQSAEWYCDRCCVRDLETFVAWTPLQAVNPAQGMPCVQMGTHRSMKGFGEENLPSLGVTLPSDVSREHLSGSSWAAAIPGMEPGDLLLFNVKCIHGMTANRSARTTLSIETRFRNGPLFKH